MRQFLSPYLVSVVVLFAQLHHSSLTHFVVFPEIFEGVRLLAGILALVDCYQAQGVLTSEGADCTFVHPAGVWALHRITR